jgi:hypothetical protein
VEGGVEAKGILVSSDMEILVVAAYNDIYFSPARNTDSFEIPPVSPSQTAFHVVNHVNAPEFCYSFHFNEFFAISASQDNTLVNVTTPNATFSLSLNRFDTFSQIAFAGDTVGFSGSKVVSSRPVSVVSGNLCEFASQESGTFITRQRPVEEYSLNYLVPAIEAPGSSGYDVHVVASEPDTLVSIDGQDTILQRDEIKVQSLQGKTSATSVSCSRPCNVLQFTNGLDFSDGLFAINVIPDNEYYSHAVFSTSEEDIVHRITVVVESASPVGDIVLDGESFEPDWSTLGDFTYATAVVGAGYHEIDASDSHFAVYTYAHSGYGGGYGYAVLGHDHDHQHL